MSTTSNHPWFEHYPPGVPKTINPDRYASLVAMCDAMADEHADYTAFSNFGTTLSYRELQNLSIQFAAYCQQQMDLKKGDRVAIMMPNILQYPVAMLGILRLGMVVVNVNPLYTATELQHQLQDAEAVAIVVLENYAHVVEQALPNTELKQVVVTKMGDLLGSVKGFAVNFLLKHVKKMVPDYRIADAVHFKDILAKSHAESFKAVEIGSDDVAFLQYTGGTTGPSKGAMLTHHNMVANVLQSTAWVRSIAIPGRDKALGALPLYHIFSLTVCCFSFIVMGLHCVLITDPRDCKRFIKILKKYPLTIFAGINTLFNKLLHDKAFKQVDFSRLKLTIAGGMAVQAATSKHWREVTGTPIVQGYGLTEASPVVCINPITEKKFNGTIGLPIPSTDVSIRDDSGKELSFGEAGELCVRGPQVMMGYWGQPEETAKVLDKQGWLRTGDIAVMDERGYVTIKDRKKDMILVSGFNVYPNEVEEVMSNIPGIDEVCVVGVDDEHMGEKVKAFIVRDDMTLTEETIIAACREHLTNYKVPKEVEFRESLPKSNVGKILRRELV